MKQNNLKQTTSSRYKKISSLKSGLKQEWKSEKGEKSSLFINFELSTKIFLIPNFTKILQEQQTNKPYVSPYVSSTLLPGSSGGGSTPL